MQWVLGPIFYPDGKVSRDAFGYYIYKFSAVFCYSHKLPFRVTLFPIITPRGSYQTSSVAFRAILPLMVPSLYSCWLSIPLWSCNTILFHQRLFPNSLKFIHWFQGLDFCILVGAFLHFLCLHLGCLWCIQSLRLLKLGIRKGELKTLELQTQEMIRDRRNMHRPGEPKEGVWKSLESGGAIETKSFPLRSQGWNSPPLFPQHRSPSQYPEEPPFLGNLQLEKLK